MNSIAKDIASGNPVTVSDVKYVLWAACCQLQSAGYNNLIELDGESISLDNILDQLDLDLGLLPGGGE